MLSTAADHTSPICSISRRILFRKQRERKKKCLSLSQTTILDSSKLKEFADDNFKFDENGRRFYKRAENTVGKGETARDEQFLIFALCFQKTCTADT